MVEIPNDVEKWTYGVIYDIIDNAYDEDETLDFKSDISREPEYIAKTCGAFANTKGGIMVFGVNNNREETLTTEQRMIGLEDSDDLKVKIINQIKNISPNIPIDKVLFKKSNIQMSNGKVLVVLKILESNISPHQYNGLCYKRISSRNIPMLIDEIKNKIIESEKNKTLVKILLFECRELEARLQIVKGNLDKNKMVGAVTTLDYLIDVDAIIHFVFHQSYLYDEKVRDNLLLIRADVRRLYQFRDLFNNVIEMSQEEFEKAYHQKENKNEWLKSQINPIIESNIERLKIIKNIFE